MNILASEPRLYLGQISDSGKAFRNRSDASRLERVRDYRDAVGQIQTGSVPVDAVAFKTVHGGPRYRGTFLIDSGLTAALRQFLPAAPAHNGIYLAAIREFQQLADILEIRSIERRIPMADLYEKVDLSRQPGS